MQQRQSLDYPLAKWFFVHPDCIVEFLKKLQTEMKKKKVLRTENDETEDDDEDELAVGKSMYRKGKWSDAAPGTKFFSVFEKVFIELQADFGAEKLPIIEQRHGDLVIVAPGWAHAVQNLRPNVKIAWDRCRASNLRKYVTSWKRHAKLKLKVKKDYALLELHLVKLAKHALSELNKIL